MTKNFVLKTPKFWEMLKTCPRCKMGELMQYVKGKCKEGYEYCTYCDAEIKVDAIVRKINC